MGGRTDDEPIEPVTWGVVRACALASVLPALVVLALGILVATDGSNDRHRDLSDVLTGLATGARAGVVAWAVCTAGLVAIAFAFNGVQRLAATRSATRA